jgi:4-oxalocrotonate tautomerase family enzyme
MPHIIVYCPVMPREKRAACVAALTTAFAESTGFDAQELVIHMEEHSYDNIGVGGQLLTDRYPELALKEQSIRKGGGG